MESPVIFYVFLTCLVGSTGAHDCTGDKCKDVVSMPLLDKMGATLKAHLDVTNMNNHLKAYIQQEIKEGVEVLMRNKMKKLVNAGLERISSTIEAKVKTGTSYIQWGRTKCTNDNTEMVYSGFVGGSSYTGGGAPNKLCVPNEPQWGIYDGKVNSSPFIGATLFDNWDINIKNTLFDNKYTYYVIQCAVCHVKKATSTIMIPGRKTCYNNWKIEYHGYLMAGYPLHKAASEYICVDGNPDHIKRVPSWADKSLLYSVYSRCNGATPCPPYVNGREMTCVVCSR